MKRDPFTNPIKLAFPPKGGMWEYLEKGMKHPLVHDNFWRCALYLSKYRKANGIARSSNEDCQMDILCKYRALVGRTCDPVEKTKVVVSPVAQRDNSIRAFKAKYTKGGCRSCGKKRQVLS